MTELGDGTEPIENDEILYRRIPVSTNWYDATVFPELSPKAFRPTRGDTTGVSLYRKKYKSAPQVAANERGKRFYVAELRAGDLREHGITVRPAPQPNEPGHAEIPDLTYENRTTERAEELQVRLAHRLCLRVLGPCPER